MKKTFINLTYRETNLLINPFTVCVVFFLFTKNQMNLKDTRDAGVYQTINYSLNNIPINLSGGPGLSLIDYNPNQVGDILSQYDTGKAISAVVMHNGYLFVPMGSDHGGGAGAGAFAFFDISDQTDPKVVFDSRNYSSKYHNENTLDYVGNWAEIHSLPVIGNQMIISERDTDKGGFSIFDTSNLYDENPNTHPKTISRYFYPGVTNPSNYDGYSFSLAVKGGRYVYSPTGTYGLYITDISNPTSPQPIAHLTSSQLSAMNPRSAVILGDLLILTEANNSSKLLVMDITDPENPVTINYKNDFNLGYQGFFYGTEFFTTGANLGIRSYDITDPTNITTKIYNSDVGNQLSTPEYGFGKDDNIFIGHYPGLTKWDLNNPETAIARCEPINPVSDDYAFITPLGNTAVIASDHGHPNKLNFGVHEASADRLPPTANNVYPIDNSTLVSINASVGIGFTDFIDPLSLNTNTIQLLNLSTNEVADGVYSQMFGIVNFMTLNPLDIDTTYEIILKSGGVKDWSGNSILNDIVISTFSTGSTIQSIKPPKINVPSPILVGETAQFIIDLQGEDVRHFMFAWDYGDGSPQTEFSSDLTSSHQYDTGSNFLVKLIVEYIESNKIINLTEIQVVSNPISEKLPSQSSKIIFDEANNLVWNVNPDNNSVSAIDATNYDLIHEISVGKMPKSLAIASNGKLWVVNSGSSNISIIDTNNGFLLSTKSLPHGSNPVSILIDKIANVAYISLQSTGEILKIDTTTASDLDTLNVGPWPGNLALDAQRNNLWVTRFISDEDSGKVTVINTTDFTLKEIVPLAISQTADGPTNGRGLPNYLGALSISPDGTQLFIPSKKDNIERGLTRDGLPLTFETTVRSMGAQIDLETNEENSNNRIDFDNSDFANSSIYSPNGNRLFVTTNGTSTIWIIDAFNLENRSEINSGGDAPDGMTISPDGTQLFVHNFMSRSVTIFNSNLVCNAACGSINQIGETIVVTNENLAVDILNGKTLFYNSNDSRMAQDGYMSCASCHLNGGHDGRVWDFTNLGEGLRNTIDLKGKGRKGHGILHWSANFDEGQDFENQIRNFSLGSGLMDTGNFNAKEDPLGAPKKGLSKDLDDLAAYLTSLDKVEESPYTKNGALTEQAELGKTVFRNNACIRCHGGEDFTDSPNKNLHDIGTLKPTSGFRLNEELLGLDTPTLRGLWYTKPYLHDGSEQTIEAAISAHNIEVDKPKLGSVDMNNLVAYLKQISNDECLVNQGEPCNDRNPNTINDIYNDTCECKGELVDEACDATGEILYQRWENIPGSITSNLTSSSNYPNFPDIEYTVTGLIEVGQDTGESYGSKFSGILCVPETGDYTFWVSGDDYTEIYLSTDIYPSNAEMIASTQGWTDFRQWTRRSSQESASILLNKNKKYYFYVLHKEGNGGDHLSVGWRKPNGVLERPMSASYFSTPESLSANNCNINPYVSVNGSILSASNFVQLASNDAVSFEPEPEDLDTSVTWQWYGPQNFAATEKDITLENITKEQEGVYTVSHTNSFGCTSIENFYLEVEDSSLNVKDIDAFDFFKVYPNPTQDILVLEMNNAFVSRTAKVDLLDITGKSILHTKTLSFDQKNTITLKTSTWAKGVYILIINTENKKIIKKIIKQ
jgi:DNA-binding beta-propeller fold protein YncE